ncbi:MAG TPA: four helix bundle protein [Lacipirellulaceae bacterium]|jgi:four helix bundle protein
MIYNHQPGLEDRRMRREQLIERTRQFALRIIRLAASLPNNRAADVIGRQLLRSGISFVANYREATRVSTKKHFASILATALREADETLYWLQLLQDSELVRRELLTDLIKESDEFAAIFASSVKQQHFATKRKTK